MIEILNEAKFFVTCATLKLSSEASMRLPQRNATELKFLTSAAAVSSRSCWLPLTLYVCRYSADSLRFLPSTDPFTPTIKLGVVL